MKKILITVLFFSTFQSFGQTGTKIHRQAIVVDTHGDILSDQIRLVRTASELKSTVTEQKMTAMIGVEDGHMIEPNGLSGCPG
ncbi:MAG: hypothetical protein ACYCZO_08315 [Daejeonella sp.]